MQNSTADELGRIAESVIRKGMHFERGDRFSRGQTRSVRSEIMLKQGDEVVI